MGSPSMALATPGLGPPPPSLLPAPVPCLPLPRHILPPSPLELHRSLSLRYSLALQHTALLPPGSLPLLSPVQAGMPEPMMSYLYGRHDPRSRFFHEEPKPSQSYIGLISMSLLSSKDQKLILGDIYQWILDNYPYFRTRGPGWRNSIRHNLSLNECFIKSGRAANGKGHYWAIHPANVEDFKRGDFRRRRAQRKVRRAMGLEVPDEEDSPSPPPHGPDSSMDWRARMLQDPAHRPRYPLVVPQPPQPPRPPQPRQNQSSDEASSPTKLKRGFDVASLLAPDTSLDDSGVQSHASDSDVQEHTTVRRQDHDDRENDVEEEEEEEEDEEEWIDVGSSDDLNTVVNWTAAKRKLDVGEEDVVEVGDQIGSKRARRDTDVQKEAGTGLDLSLSPNQGDDVKPDDLRVFNSGGSGGGGGGGGSGGGGFLPASSSSTSFPRPGLPPLWLNAGRSGAFFPGAFLPWSALPPSFSAALYANALSRPNTETSASQHVVSAAAAAAAAAMSSAGVARNKEDNAQKHEALLAD